jgi:hypothetical protein
MSEVLDFYLRNSSHIKGEQQSRTIDKILEFFFDFPSVECIETGVSYGGNDDNFGIYLAKFTQQYGGKMCSVDIDWQRVEKSQKFIDTIVDDIDYSAHTLDSIQFLREYTGSPNLVHLDSYDLDITNPLPSMLHHWLEFVEIKDKMKSGSILMVDDNYFRGTTVYWNIIDHNGNLVEVQPTDITQEIIGKGSLIYHAVKEKKVKDWELIGDHYYEGPNQKLIFRKL